MTKLGYILICAAGNTPTSAAELSRMAQELQSLVGQFKVRSDD